MLFNFFAIQITHTASCEGHKLGEIAKRNPITMARMNRLYGVTMGEQGVSQLVSVDLQTAELMREAS